MHARQPDDAHDFCFVRLQTTWFVSSVAMESAKVLLQEDLPVYSNPAIALVDPSLHVAGTSTPKA